MNALDRLISALSPTAGLRRAAARAQLQAIGFRRKAAVAGKNRAMADQPLDHPDGSRNHSDRVTLIKEARELEESNEIIASILRKYMTFAVGRLNYIPRTKRQPANDAIQYYVNQWMENADLTGRHSFRALAGLTVTSVKRDGDIGFIVHEVKDNEPGTSPIRLQAIEADRIGAVWRAGSPGAKPFKPLKTGEQDFSGVVVDKNGRPDRYRVFSRQQSGDILVPWGDVKARDFLHIFDPIRLDGYRGFSAFSTAINDIKDMAELLGIEKIGVKHLCSIAGIVNNEAGAAPDDVMLDASHPNYDETADTIRAINPGEVKYIGLNEKFSPISMERPSPTFSGFLETLIRLTGLSVNLPFGFIYSWAGQGTAVRMEAAQAAREFEQTQLVLEEKLLNPIIRRVIARGIDLGHIPAVIDFDAGEWRYPAKVTADVGRESKAIIEENMSGLISKTQIAADRGEDRKLVRDFIKAEALELVEDAKAIVASSGGEIDLKLALFMLEKRQPNAPMESQEPAEPEDDKPPPKKEAAEAIHPAQPQSFHINANLTPANKRRSVTFRHDKEGKVLGAEIEEED